MRKLYGDPDHPTIAAQLKLFFSLPFVRLEDIPTVFAEITAPGFLDPRLVYMKDYFDLTWVGHYCERPIFDRALWNVHNHTVVGAIRTNNRDRAQVAPSLAEHANYTDKQECCSTVQHSYFIVKLACPTRDGDTHAPSL